METERTVVNPACAEGCLQWCESRSCARVRLESLTYLTQRHGNGTSCCEPVKRRRMFTVKRKPQLRSCQAGKPDLPENAVAPRSELKINLTTSVILLCSGGFPCRAVVEKRSSKMCQDTDDAVSY